MFKTLSFSVILMALSFVYSGTAEAQFEAWGSEESASATTHQGGIEEYRYVSPSDRARSMRTAGIVLSSLGPVVFNAAFTSMPDNFSTASIFGLASGISMLVAGTVVGIVGLVMGRRHRSWSRRAPFRLLANGGGIAPNLALL